MKKLILCAAAAAALAGTGGAFAQSAECARSMDGSDPCGPVTNPVYRSGPPYVLNPNQPYTYGGWPGQVLGAGPWGLTVPQAVIPQYNVTRRDRDGDGVRNNRDRYPDDPRYR
jgi:hypothetical protein